MCAFLWAERMLYNMADWKLHTPIGMTDILPEECAKKKEVESTIWSVFASFGYQETETPTFEYYDVFSGGGKFSTGLSQESMIKFFDEHGRILTLRPDITTSIARLAATKTEKLPLPLRFCYTGNVFRAEQTQGVRQREFTQAGIELLGAGAPTADAEVIAAAIEAILALGIEEFHMEIGQVAFFNGLVEQAGLDAESIEKLRERIDSKDRFGIRELTESLELEEQIKDLMMELPYLFGGQEVIEKARVQGLNPISSAALDNIEKIYSLLSAYGFEKFISIDLGMLQSIDYYTGSIFKCYTHGVGFPICAGGRYDRLVSQFGRNLEAVGVAFGINRILSALRHTEAEHTHKVSKTLLYTEKDADAVSYELAFNLRINGCLVEQYLLDETYQTAEAYAKEIGAEIMIRAFADGKLLIKDFIRNEIIETNVVDFIGYYAGEDDDCGCGHEHHHCDCNDEHCHCHE